MEFTEVINIQKSHVARPKADRKRPMGPQALILLRAIVRPIVRPSAFFSVPPRRLQESPKTIQDSPKRFQDDPKSTISTIDRQWKDTLFSKFANPTMRYANRDVQVKLGSVKPD